MQRNTLVDKLKGYACFLVLFGHVIMGIRLAGINIPQFFEGMEKFIWSFHVALFLFLSGVVYKVTDEWRGKGSRWKFILHKLYNLGIPYIVFSVVYILINSFVGQANTQSSFGDVLTIWRTPVAQYWYLYALFFLFCIWTAFSGVLNNLLITVIVASASYIAPIFGISFGIFDLAIYSALAFGVGTFINFSVLEKPPVWVRCLVVFFHICVSVALIFFDMIEAPYVKDIMLLFGIYSSISFISLIQEFKPVSHFLNFVNKYSFQIYLLHTIFTAGIRIVLMRFNITEWWIHVILGTVCGLVFSVLAAIIAKKIKFFNFFFFPSKTFPAKKGAKANG